MQDQSEAESESVCMVKSSDNRIEDPVTWKIYVSDILNHDWENAFSNASF